MKKILMILGISLFALTIVTAIGYYAIASISINVKQPISVTGNLQQSIDCIAGDTCYGEDIVVSNSGDKERTIKVSNDNTNEDIKISYAGEIELTQKNVVFGQEPWTIPIDAEKVKIRYALINNKFSAEVIDGTKEGYALIYYKDNNDRFNDPAKAINTNDVLGNLPYSNDANEEHDYCLTGEYSTCHGAKIWYVPTNAINEDGSLDWNMASEFYYETFLIQYNSEGSIIVYPNSSVAFKPAIVIDEYANTQTITFRTQIA